MQVAAFCVSHSCTVFISMKYSGTLKALTCEIGPWRAGAFNVKKRPVGRKVLFQLPKQAICPNFPLPLRN